MEIEVRAGSLLEVETPLTAWVAGQRWVPPYLSNDLATGVGVRLLDEFCRLWAEAWKRRNRT